MSIFGKIGKVIATPFILLGRAIFGSEGLKFLANAIEELLKTELGQIAWVAVKAAQGIADKSLARQQAFDEIRRKISESGHEAKDSAINLAIELLVQRLKSEGVEE